MRTTAPNSRWPEHGDDEHTATTFQLSHNHAFPKDHNRGRFEVGDHVVYPLGTAVVTWLDEETGDCLVRTDEAIIKDMIRALEAAVNLIDQYEEPRKQVCRQPSMTRTFIATTLKAACHQFGRKP